MRNYPTHARWQPDQRQRRRAGLTLMELLVVIFLVGLITAVTIPVLNPQAAPRRIREAARMVDGALSVARNRAIAEGRPVGVWLERMPAASGKASACTKIFFAEQPQTYAGETMTSTIKVTSGTATFTPSTIASRINAGDVIQINYQGYLYQVPSKPTGLPPKAKLVNVLDGSAPPNTPTVSGLTGLPFQVFRLPVKSAEKPLQLPSGIAIDLAASGIGNSPFPASGTDPVIVMFSPGGAMSAVYSLSSGTLTTATDTLFLLVGRTDGLVTNFSTENNYSDPGTIWVTVGNQSGMVSTAENKAGGTDASSARAYAQTRNSMGGK